MAKRNKTVGYLLNSSSDLFKTTSDVPYIPSIIEFCYGEQYLNLRKDGITLYPIQDLMLRTFYRGSIGNDKPEHMAFSEEDRKLCIQKGLTDKHNGNIIGKWESGELFRELVLVWGRRSGKDWCCSIIALYEAMRLLECPGGDPYKMYKLGNDSPFTILTIANNKEQARILYGNIRGKLQHSPYFRDKCILPDGITNEKFHLLTPQNKKDNEEALKTGMPKNLGSVVIETGHSNSNGLVGKGCFILMLDECGLYKRTGGPGSDEQIYGNLSPTTKSYKIAENIYDKDNKLIDVKYHYHGKVISISSPRGMDGVFYNLYKDAENVPQRLMCRLPTWEVAPHTEEGLRKEDPSMTDAKFRMEFGAEFSGTEGGNFFDPSSVEKCFIGHKWMVAKDAPDHWGQPGITYFAHLDPAISNHNYALCVVHKQYFINEDDRKVNFFVVLDHLKVWIPGVNKPIRIEEVDQYVLDLNRRYRLGLVTYDDWNSQSSIEKLRRNGIPAKRTHFSRRYKMEIYGELESLVNGGRLKLPYHKLLHDEMTNLQRRYGSNGNGYKIYPKADGECRTDDLMDALAGATFSACQVETTRLPMSKLVNLSITPSQTLNQSQGNIYTKDQYNIIKRVAGNRYGMGW